MAELDLKDRKILYQLDLNCRQSNSQIGKKVGLGRNVVAYRINKMQEDGIINCFFSVIDTFKLGYNVFRVYLKFQDISLENKNELIQCFVDYKNSWAVSSSAGKYDLGAVIWVDDCFKFFGFLEKIFNKYGKYISNKIVSLYIQGEEYEKSYLLYDEKVKGDKKKFIVSCNSNRDEVKIDETDYKILNILSLDARIPLIDLADKVGISSQTVNYRLNNLMKTGIIIGYRVDIDISKLGLQYFDIRIDLLDYSYKSKIIRYLEEYPFFKCINTAVGYADLELEVILESLDALISLMEEINIKFPSVIRDYHFLNYRVNHKECWLPKMF